MAEDRKTSQDHDDVLDPRIKDELEKLNRASEDINRLELLLDDARSTFRQVLTDSTQQLNTLSKKLGSCIEKARPYYEARLKATEAQRETQNAALRYERACGQLVAAKEMVNLAEQGFFRKEGQPFDPAWQEMLNHATIKVNDAENERYESELEHQATAAIFNDAERTVHELAKDLKRHIVKSRSYFEQKAQFNQRMEEQKKLVGELEEAVVAAKSLYAEALGNLEKISDEIHMQRGDVPQVESMGKRGTGVGAESPSPPPSESSPDDEQERQLLEQRRKTISAWLEEAFGRRGVRAGSTGSEGSEGVPKIDVTSPPRDKTPGEAAGSAVAGPAKAEKSSISAFPPPTESELSIALNADVMESLQKAKGIQLLKLPPPRRHSSDTVLEEGSDSGGGSAGGVTCGGSISGLDDEQVEHIMKEMWDMEQFMSWLEKSEKWSSSPLPARLTYLEDYIQSRETRMSSGGNSSSEEDHLTLGDKGNPSYKTVATERLVFKVGDEKWATVVRMEPDGTQEERRDSSWAALVSIDPGEEKEGGETAADTADKAKAGTKQEPQASTASDLESRRRMSSKGFVVHKILHSNELEKKFSGSTLKVIESSTDESRNSSTEVLPPSASSSRNGYITCSFSPGSSESEMSAKRRMEGDGKMRSMSMSSSTIKGIIPVVDSEENRFAILCMKDIPCDPSRGFEFTSESEPRLASFKLPSSWKAGQSKSVDQGGEKLPVPPPGPISSSSDDIVISASPRRLSAAATASETLPDVFAQKNAPVSPKSSAQSGSVSSQQQQKQQQQQQQGTSQSKAQLQQQQQKQQQQPQQQQQQQQQRQQQQQQQRQPQQGASASYDVSYNEPPLKQLPQDLFAKVSPRQKHQPQQKQQRATKPQAKKQQPKQQQQQQHQQQHHQQPVNTEGEGHGQGHMHMQPLSLRGEGEQPQQEVTAIPGEEWANNDTAHSPPQIVSHLSVARSTCIGESSLQSLPDNADPYLHPTSPNLSPNASPQMSPQSSGECHAEVSRFSSPRRKSTLVSQGQQTRRSTLQKLAKMKEEAAAAAAGAEEGSGKPQPQPSPGTSKQHPDEDDAKKNKSQNSNANNENNENNANANEDTDAGNGSAVEWKMCKPSSGKKPLEECSNSGSSASEWGSKETPDDESSESDIDRYFTTRL